MSLFNLAILSTHPIQYHAAWYRALAACPELRMHVYYCHKATPREQARAGFGVEFDWDVDLLSGYPHTFLRNVAGQPGNGRFAGLDTPEISSILRRGGYDAVLVNGWHYKSAWQAIWAAWRAGLKVMVRGDSHLHTPRSPLRKMVKELAYRRFIPHFDACLAAGQWSRDYFLYYGAPVERVFLVPHAVEVRRPAENSAPGLRQKFGLRDEALVFLFAGKFIAKKRPLDFLHAFHRSCERGAPAQALMVGDGPLRPACEEFVRLTGVPVAFAGFLNQSQIAEAYLAADVLVLPSDGGETWGLVVNEAMACGRACIVSDRVGCGPDLIRNRQTGAIFPLGDVEALAALFSQFARDRDGIRFMGARAERVIRKYSVEAAVEGVLQALAAVTRRQTEHATA